MPLETNGCACASQWLNPHLAVIIAILLIGIVGMLLDQILARFARMVTFPE